MIELVEDASITHASLDLSDFDLFVLALGYELRSSAFPRLSKGRAARSIAISFAKGHVHSYLKNLSVLKEYDCEVVELEDSYVRDFVTSELTTLLLERKDVRIAIDISSFTRVRLASVVLALVDAAKKGRVDVTFLYSLAEYSSPAEQEQPNAHFGPVLPEYAGWFESADDPPIAIVGLGYEQDRALGALEHLQIDERRLFLPQSPDTRFESQLLDANSALLGLSDRAEVFRYSLSDPIATLGRIQSIVRGVQLSGNVLLLPFGPKIFALVCLLFGASNQAAAVWRVSTEGGDPEVDVAESGVAVSLRVLFGDPPRVLAL